MNSTVHHRQGATMTNHQEGGVATGGVRLLLRLEGLALLAAATAGYAWAGVSWWLFAILFLTPDISLVAYFAGSRTGALVYNALHSTIGPLALLVAGILGGQALLVPLGLIWAAHLGFDRALGYGLKYEAGFGITHLGRIGRNMPSPSAR
jgi:hypothetical protein